MGQLDVSPWFPEELGEQDDLPESWTITSEPADRRAAALTLEDELVANATQQLPSLRLELLTEPALLEKYKQLAADYGTHKRVVPDLALVQRAQRDWGWPTNRRGMSADADGRMFYKGNLWIPPPLRVAYLRAAHSGGAPTHVGAKVCRRTLRAVGWNGLNANIGAYVGACHLCQCSRSADGVTNYPPGTSPVDALFARVHIDTWSATWPRA